ncbi:MAG TPA: hypothetical protein VF681_12180 [Abditibacteriaceae bacterium]|jgi:D-alanyl-D-alanine dipeptidase
MNASISARREPITEQTCLYEIPTEAAHFEREASQLRATLMSLAPASRPRLWDKPGGVCDAPSGLVDVRHVAPGVRILSSPPWSAPVERHWVHSGVAMRLELAAHALPCGRFLGFWEGFRPLSIQRSLWHTGLELVSELYPTLSTEQLENLLETYIARPTPDAPHTRGRAVDVAILDEEGRVRDDREHLRLLSQALTESGLSNYEPEWWHWSLKEAAGIRAS